MLPKENSRNKKFDFEHESSPDFFYKFHFVPPRKRNILKQYSRTSRKLRHFPDGEETGGPWNVALVAIQPPNAAASPKMFYWIRSPYKL
jgi:hypothetical protein